MTGVPSLPVYKRFAILENTAVSESIEMRSTPELQTETTPTNKIRRRSPPRWERRLPKQYTLAATPNPRSLSIKVELQTTDTAEVRASAALIDSGATGKFLDKRWVEEQRIDLIQAAQVNTGEGVTRETGGVENSDGQVQDFGARNE